MDFHIVLEESNVVDGKEFGSSFAGDGGVLTRSHGEEEGAGYQLADGKVAWSGCVGD